MALNRLIISNQIQIWNHRVAMSRWRHGRDSVVVVVVALSELLLWVSSRKVANCFSLVVSAAWARAINNGRSASQSRADWFLRPRWRVFVFLPACTAPIKCGPIYENGRRITVLRFLSFIFRLFFFLFRFSASQRNIAADGRSATSGRRVGLITNCNYQWNLRAPVLFVCFFN